MRRHLLLPVLCSLLSATGAARAAVHYVATTGADSASCTSPGAPCRNPQKAVVNAGSGDEIRLAGGTYVFPGAGLDTCSTSGLGVSAVVCVINKQLTLKGGFATSNWTTPDPNGNPTILDGQSSRRAVVLEHTSGGGAASLTIEGLTIAHGRGTARASENPPNAFGGGMEVVWAPVTLRNVRFESNTVVGTNSAGDFAHDTAGGGLALRSPLNQPPPLATLEDVVFLANVSDAGDNTGATGRGGYGHGGGLFTYGFTLVGSRLLFDSNEARGGNAATSDGAAANGARGDALGGGASFEFGSAVTLDDSVFAGNLALGGVASASLAGATASGAFGGALFAEGLAAEPTSVTLTDSDVVQNEARGGNARSGGLARGGGLMAQDATAIVERCAFVDNLVQGGDGTASGARGPADGGAATVSDIADVGATTSWVNCWIVANAARMGTVGTIPGGGGGGLAFQGLAATLRHLTIADNAVQANMQGQGLLVFGTPFAATADLDFAIVAGHAAASVAAMEAQSGAALDLGRTLVAGNFDDTAGAGAITGMGNLLPAASAGFVAPGSPLFDYHLTAGSDAVDEATGSSEPLDFDGQARTAPRDLGGDELGLPSLIFADGFETGGVCAWSAPC